ncbi:AAA family ATPase [Paludibacter sp. 221]|uniref:ATP-binding protein n=1 Tax=Paludibacter sp. 221 TaxID=2302939 RepID=UPI0013D7FC9E|nr:SbcC/MukB-like Walker B domain-containing protein [Paludibacter sp. 221]NDV46331.1 AAA family ATPase [Paludibacter sp. 221]
MYSLFTTSSDTAGFRLHYMEIYNWGTFDKKIVRINPQGNNSLLTGANASGKSTLIDALLTLLVPLHKDRFYNQSSGVEKKGDRNETTYVLGNYANQQQEGEKNTTKLQLRDKKTYSVILTSFFNSDQRIVTLFQIRWFANNELKTAFGLSREQLTIQNDFSNFDPKGAWKRLLDKKYNANATKKRIEFFNGPTEYAKRIVGLFGMRDINALGLFNQIVGVKVLDDLDGFVRHKMLEEYKDKEEKNAEDQYIDLIKNFDELMSAKINIDKTKEQIKLLQPIDEIADKLTEIQAELGKLQHSKEMAVYFFAKKKVELAKKEFDKCNAKLEILKEDLAKLKEKEKELKNQETDLTVQIKTDAVGNQIEKLKTEIGRLETSKKNRSDKLDNYNKITQKVGFSENPTEETFKENREKASEKKGELVILLEKKAEELRQKKNKEDEIQKNIDINIETIQSLQKNKNNISGRVAEIRNDILIAVDATAEEIPFIGELMRIRDSEKDWESSIEKILHNFALRLIVPEKYYTKVNEFVNANNLRGRIVYQRYRDFTSLKTLEHREISPNSLLNKIEFKPKNTYVDWLEDVIYNQYNYACVNDLYEFSRYEERAVTQEGLIKSVKGKHEKDDRPHISQKENYVLGWDNKEKIALIKNEVLKLQEEQKQIVQQIRIIEKTIKDTNTLKDDLSDLFKIYTKYDDIDWQSYANTIQEKKEQKNELGKTNDKVKKLQEQLAQVQSELKTLTDVTIKNKDGEIFQIEKNELININKAFSENSILLEQLGEIDVTNFETGNAEFQNLSYENIEIKLSEFQTKNKNETGEQEIQQNENKLKITRLINQFKNPSQEITEKYRDWRSDVNKLPDSEHLELVAEYQSFYKKLIEEDLIRFEKKFNNYLRETITNKVSAFRMFFKNWEDSITENIRHLNESLKGIDFNNNPTTYIKLVAPKKLSDEANDFRNLLDKAIPNIREVDATIEGRKNHFTNHIEPLIEKLKNEQWRKKVMEVRAWFIYKAEEFYKETNAKKQTYESMGQLSGGEKAQLTYTILGSAIAYQFGLTKDGLQSKSFRFIAIDEAFKAQDEEKARYLISLCKQLHLQLLVVTPSNDVHIVENDISFVHYVERKGNESVLYDMPIEQFKSEREKFVSE